MKNKIKKTIRTCCDLIVEYIGWLFFDASRNQIRFAKAGKNRFFSYTRLKKYQKRVRRVVSIIALIMVSLIAGLVVGPVLFPGQIESDVYIPNGKGDIIIGNISKNQATVIFKTLDGANENKPLATKAVVEVYGDKNFTSLVRQVRIDDYAVTHIVTVDNLQENKIYYIRISATDSAEKPHSKIVTSWGDGADLINFYTSGELFVACAMQNENQNNVINQDVKKNAVTENSDTTNNVRVAIDMREAETDKDGSSLQIFDVQNESHLQPKNKIQTLISWKTNFPASTMIVYSEGSEGEKREIVVNGNQEQKKHLAVMTTLKTSTTYYFKVKSIGKDGLAVLSEEYSLRTPRANESVVEKIMNNFKSLLHQIKPN